MSTVGLFSLLIAFAGVAVSVVALLLGLIFSNPKRSQASRERSETFLFAGHAAIFLTFAGLTVACGILVYAFFVGDMTIDYVLQEHSDSSSSIAWLYKLAGLWAGREGSLLFWTWLISLFTTVITARNMKRLERLDSAALLVLALVIAAFVGVLLFSEDNMPFTVTDSKYFNSDGTLTTAASLLGMNTLLEHWAMAIHPPTLFVGYAGLTVPFAFAIGALIVNDSSPRWVEKCTRYAIFSWLFLGIGIGLGAVWAYVVLGWGGYWGWDPVENASLLSWLVGVALIHSMTVYRQRGAFKRWTVLCACLTFAFVIVGTFISRSGLVQSVHAFEGDAVSLVLFLALIILSLLTGIIGLIVRRKTFKAAENGNDDFESMLSRDAAYYFNNVIMVVFAILLAYLTIASALPTWLPFGGTSVSTGTYNAIARPLGIFYLAILAICPLLSWGKTEGKAFWKRARIPGILALILFIGLAVYFFTNLYPAYNAIIDAGGTTAEELQEDGPWWYYNGLALVGFAVASILFFNALFMLGRNVRAHAKAKNTNVVAGFFSLIATRCSALGGCLAHVGMSVILIGLIGSSMYVTETATYIDYDSDTDTCSEDLYIQDYTLVFQGSSVEELANGDDIMYTVVFDVYKDDQYIGTVSPAVQFVQSTQQQKLVASVLGFADKDLFVVYRGVNTDGDLSMDVRVNPLIVFVWAGFIILILGGLISALGRHKKKELVEATPQPEAPKAPKALEPAEAAEEAAPVEATALDTSDAE